MERAGQQARGLGMERAGQQAVAGERGDGAEASSGARRSSPTSVMASCMSESGVSVVSA